MSRGDAPRLQEWVEYHVWLGFNEFHIVLDNPCDDSAQVLRSLDLPALVTVDERPAINDYYDEISASERWEQVKAWRTRNADSFHTWGWPVVDSLVMRQCLNLPSVLNKYALQRNGWLALIDVDEFLVLPGERKIQDVVADAKAPRLRFLNYNFDTMDRDLSRPILEQHSRRWAREDIVAYGQGWDHRVKTIARYDSLFPFQSVHSISPGPFEILPEEVGRLHHYKATDQGIAELPYRVEDRTAAEAYRMSRPLA